MSNKNVKELVKNVIEENAVAFKTTLNRTLYSKVGQKLQEKYVQLSQNIFEVAGDRDAGPPTTMDGLNTPQFDQNNPITLPKMRKAGERVEKLALPKTDTPGAEQPWKLNPPPPVGTTYWYLGRQFRYNGGGWDVYENGKWRLFWWGEQERNY
jgi:hypothetical protein